MMTHSIVNYSYKLMFYTISEAKLPVLIIVKIVNISGIILLCSHY